MHYLDNSATTRVCPEAAQAALSAMTECFGNPSSTYTLGREAKKLLDRSRKQVSDALGCAPGELVFTSCGSESDNWAILGGAEAMKRRGKHVISSLVEHDASAKVWRSWRPGASRSPGSARRRTAPSPRRRYWPPCGRTRYSSP